MHYNKTKAMNVYESVQESKEHPDNDLPEYMLQHLEKQPDHFLDTDMMTGNAVAHMSDL